MLKISPEVMAAFDAQVDAQTQKRILALWMSNFAVLGAPPDYSGTAILVSGEALAKEYGVFDNDEERIFLCAAAVRLMPRLSGGQALLLGDILFADQDVQDRLNRLRSLADDPQARGTH